MARKKTVINKELLINTIQLVEGQENPPKYPTDVFKTVADILNVSVGAVMGRVKDYGIQIKTKPGRTFKEIEVKPADPPVNVAYPPAPSSEQTIDLSPFTRRGIEVASLGDLLTSSLRTPDENRLRRDAWAEIRRQEGLPKPEEGYV